MIPVLRGADSPGSNSRAQQPETGRRRLAQSERPAGFGEPLQYGMVGITQLDLSHAKNIGEMALRAIFGPDWFYNQ